MSFDRLAPFYRVLEAVTAGRKLQRCRLAYLAEIARPQRVLLAGEGHGRVLPTCLAQFPEAKIVVIDSSARMLEIARSQVHSERVSFVHADLLTWDPATTSFDLIVTHFFLDCFTPLELEAVVEKLAQFASPAANWLLADFEIAPAGMARLRSRMIVALLYQFFHLVCRLRPRTLTAPDRLLERAGFTRHRRTTWDWGLLKSEWWWRLE
jgi:ubiquinone/menaquinone biosynthesis C-methylase UbiE